ncbi:MAG: amidase [Nitrososphaerota archaeon]
MVDLAKTSIRGIHREVRSLRIKPTKIIEECLRRIHRLNDALRIFIHLSEEAIKHAEYLEKELEEGKCRSELHGLPIAVKDAFYTYDMPTTGGSIILKDYKPPKDAEVVRKLRDAGAIIIGKTNMHEFAFGVTNKNPHYGVTRNPWSIDRISGGSSGGSAVAVSVGVCIGGLGTDTAGSIRIPSALCGVVGYKPSNGLLSLDGVIPLSHSLDTVGPIVKTVDDVSITLNIMTGKVLTSQERVSEYEDRELRLGLPRKLIEEWVSDEVEEVFWRSIGKITSRSNCRIVDIEIEWFKTISDARYIIVLSESAAFHLKWLRNRWSEYDPDVRDRILGGLFITAPVYIQAQMIRKSLKRKFLKMMKNLDAVILPTVPIEAPRVEDEELIVKNKKIGVRRALLFLTECFNSLGTPAITIPCGLTKGNLPVGLQIATKPYEDTQLLEIAERFEGVLGRLPEPPIIR